MPTEAKSDDQQSSKDLDSLKTKLELKKLELEIQDLAHPAGKRLSTLIPLLSVLAALLGIWGASYQSRRSIEETEQRQRNEAFAQAVENIESKSYSKRASAVLRLASFAKDPALNDTKPEALTVLVRRLQIEDDETVLRLLVQTMIDLGNSSLPYVVKANREAKTNLTRTLGKYVGVSLRKRVPTLTEFRDSNPQQTRLETARIFTDLNSLLLSSELTLGDPFQAEWKLSSFTTAPIYFSALNRYIGPVNKDLSQADLEGWFLDDVRALWTTSFTLTEIFRQLSGKLKKQDLSGITLLSADLDGIDLSGAILDDSIFQEAHLNSARFCSASLKRSYIDADPLNTYHADFGYADLSFATIGSRLSDAALTGAILTGTFISAIPPKEGKTAEPRIPFDVSLANWSEMRDSPECGLTECEGAAELMDENRELTAKGWVPVKQVLNDMQVQHVSGPAKFVTSCLERPPHVN